MIGDMAYYRTKTLDEYLCSTARRLDAIDAGSYKPKAHAEGSYYRAPLKIRQRVRELLADRAWVDSADDQLRRNVEKATAQQKAAQEAAEAAKAATKAALEPEIAPLKAMFDSLSTNAKHAFAGWISEWWFEGAIAAEEAETAAAE